jgi:CHAT domain-containing protein
MLEFTHYTPFEDRKGLFGKQQRLVAFVMRREGPLTWVDLGPVESLEKLIEAWRGKMQARLFEDRNTAQELREKLWNKLEGPLGDAKTILISPDGVASRFAWGALPGKQPATYLIEERAVAIVPVPQLLPQLLGDQPGGTEPPPESLLVVGDVAYGGSTGKSGDLLASRSAPTNPGQEKMWDFRDLEHTRAEVVAIADSFGAAFSKAPTQRLNREGATESAFRQQAPKHRWLHLSTHGYFAPTKVKSALAEQESGAERATFFGREGVTGWHPGLLSGLAMAGANTPPKEGEDDGILTALEVAALDLRNVEMVVLSACETGLGKAAGGEGVLGLQRAFQTSGARSAVASLWSVDDLATKDLIIRFYENVWRKKMPKLEALRQAQLWMLREGRSAPGGKDRGLKRIGKDPATDQPVTDRVPPYYWAAFVLSGDWR